MHAEWKLKFQRAISNAEMFDVAIVAADDCCALGGWLSGDAKRLMGDSRSLQDCAAKHAAFHREAGRVAQAINAGKMPEATAMISDGTPYARLQTHWVHQMTVAAM
jgi:methyl-accepting chemotaxis protein